MIGFLIAVACILMVVNLLALLGAGTLDFERATKELPRGTRIRLTILIIAGFVIACAGLWMDWMLAVGTILGEVGFLLYILKIRSKLKSD